MVKIGKINKTYIQLVLNVRVGQAKYENLLSNTADRIKCWPIIQRTSRNHNKYKYIDP